MNIYYLICITILCCVVCFMMGYKLCIQHLRDMYVLAIQSDRKIFNKKLESVSGIYKQKFFELSKPIAKYNNYICDIRFDYKANVYVGIIRVRKDEPIVAPNIQELIKKFRDTINNL